MIIHCILIQNISVMSEDQFRDFIKSVIESLMTPFASRINSGREVFPGNSGVMGNAVNSLINQLQAVICEMERHVSDEGKQKLQKQKDILSKQFGLIDLDLMVSEEDKKKIENYNDEFDNYKNELIKTCQWCWERVKQSGKFGFSSTSSSPQTIQELLFDCNLVEEVPDKLIDEWRINNAHLRDLDKQEMQFRYQLLNRLTDSLNHISSNK